MGELLRRRALMAVDGGADSRYWKVFSVADDLYQIGLTVTYSQTVNVEGYGTAHGVRSRSDRTSYIDFDLLIDTNYTYTFEYEGSGVRIGIVRYNAIPWSGTPYDPGWQSSGYTFNPNDGKEKYCFRFTLNYGKSGITSRGTTEIRIIRTPISQ